MRDNVSTRVAVSNLNNSDPNPAALTRIDLKTRRVKCGERVPECIRCAVANVACAGYEQQRVVVPVKPRARTQQQRLVSSSVSSPEQTPQREGTLGSTCSISSPRVQNLARELTHTVIDHCAPLVAFPSGPRSGQSPSPGARHVLGYHQVLLRTIPMLFPPQHLRFWRDEFLQEAWGCDYLYLTFVALGNSHRAALMGLADNDSDRSNGLDMKITAVKLYTQALEELAEHLEEAKQTPALLVATLCLMAYFEVSSLAVTANSLVSC